MASVWTSINHLERSAHRVDIRQHDERPFTTPVLRIAPAPDTDPRPTGHGWGAPSPGTRQEYVQGCLAMDFRLDDTDAFFGPQATPTVHLPEPGRWAARMVHVLLEVSDGTRPIKQVSRWVSPTVRERLARRGQLARQRGRRRLRAPVVRRVLVCLPAPSVAEVSAVVQIEGRVRAVAIRMVGQDGRWLITEWELG